MLIGYWISSIIPSINQSPSHRKLLLQVLRSAIEDVEGVPRRCRGYRWNFSKALNPWEIRIKNGRLKGKIMGKCGNILENHGKSMNISINRGS